jgi:hypothetical protein
MLLGPLLMHNVTCGPQFISNSMDLVYMIIVAIFAAFIDFCRHGFLAMPNIGRCLNGADSPRYWCWRFSVLFLLRRLVGR